MVVFFCIFNGCICCQVSLKEISESIHAHVHKYSIEVSSEMQGPILFPFVSSSPRSFVKVRTSHCYCHTSGDGASEGGSEGGGGGGGTLQATLGTFGNQHVAAPTSRTSCRDAQLGLIAHSVGHFP